MKLKYPAALFLAGFFIDLLFRFIYSGRYTNDSGNLD